MKKTILLLLIGFVSTSIYAQQSTDIKQIKNWYYTTKKQIEYSKKNQNGVAYCNVIERNKHRSMGTYYAEEQFWSSFNDDNTRLNLDMVIVNRDFSYYEYLYHDGQLVFVFCKDEYNQHRFYFKNKKLIKELRGTNVGEGMITPTAESLLQTSETYMQQHLSLFCD